MSRTSRQVGISRHKSSFVAPTLIAHAVASLQGFSNPYDAVTSGINTSGANLLIAATQIYSANSVTNTVVSSKINGIADGNVWHQLANAPPGGGFNFPQIWYSWNPTVSTAANHTFMCHSNSGGDDYGTSIAVAAFSNMKSIADPWAGIFSIGPIAGAGLKGWRGIGGGPAGGPFALTGTGAQNAGAGTLEYLGTFLAGGSNA